MRRFILLFCLLIIALFREVCALSFDELQDVIATEICKREKNPNIKIELSHHKDLENRDDISYGSINIQNTGKFVANVFLEKKKYLLHGSFYKYVSIPVVKRKIIKGQMISEDDVEMKDLAVSSLPPSVIMQTDEVIGKMAKRNLEINTPLKKNDVKKHVIVARGDLVTLKFVRRNLEIKTLATALNAGGIGDLIKVKIQDSNKIMLGEIIDSSTVKIRDDNKSQ